MQVIYRQSISFLLAILTITLFNQSIFAKPYQSDQAPTQEAAIRIMKRIHSNASVRLSPTRYSGILSSYLSERGTFNDETILNLGFEPVYFHNRDGNTTEGYAFIPDEPRPFLVCVAGIGGSKASTSLRNCARDFKNRNYYGIIILENSTNPNWINRNNTLALSGFEAGWDLYLTLEQIRKDPKIAPFISELHLMGFSLGGNNVAYANFFDSFNKTNLIDGSIISVSGPADRFKALDDVRSKQGPIGKVIQQIIQRIYQAAKPILERYTEISEVDFTTDWPMDKLNKEIFLPFMQDYLFNHRNLLATIINILSLPRSFQVSELTTDHIKALFQIDAFLPHMSKPMLFLHSQNDPVVNYSNVSDTLEKLDNKSFIGYRGVRYGGHIGYLKAYGNGWLSRNVLRYTQYWGGFDPEYYEVNKNW